MGRRKKIGICGGIWDKVLLEYCENKRSNPTWAIGELDYRKEGEVGTYINSVENIIFVKKKDKETILDSIRLGNLYVLLNGRLNHYPVLNEFFVKKEIKINISHNDKISRKVIINLIKNGRLFQRYEQFTPIDLSIQDKMKEAKGYYRLEIISVEDSSTIITNPIFVEGKK
ncbi:MAG: hypothetical protein ABH873_06645 [Candidatus Firestonebacteria bacterium]